MALGPWLLLGIGALALAKARKAPAASPAPGSSLPGDAKVRTPVSDRSIPAVPPITSAFQLVGRKFAPFSDGGTVIKITSISDAADVLTWQVVSMGGLMGRYGDTGTLLASDFLAQLSNGSYREVT